MRIAVVFDPAETCSVRGARHFDLHLDAGAIERIDAARQHVPMRTFLANVNTSDSIFATIGCKVWTAVEPANTELEVFASRVDLIFLQEATNFGRGPHEDLASRLAQLLERDSGETLRSELRISPVEFAGEDRGFCLRMILFARGATREQAEARWGLGLARMQQALLFVARGLRHHIERASVEEPADLEEVDPANSPGAGPSL
jgi:hypothetical protein